MYLILGILEYSNNNNFNTCTDHVLTSLKSNGNDSSPPDTVEEMDNHSEIYNSNSKHKNNIPSNNCETSSNHATLNLSNQIVTPISNDAHPDIAKYVSNNKFTNPRDLYNKKGCPNKIIESYDSANVEMKGTSFYNIYKLPLHNTPS